jgi:hypothetical protein
MNSVHYHLGRNEILHSRMRKINGKFDNTWVAPLKATAQLTLNVECTIAE